jgi:hypothetical protein
VRNSTPNLNKTLFRNSSYLIIGWIMVLFLLGVGIAVLAVNGIGIADLWTVVAWLFCFVFYRSYIRAKVTTSTSGITIVNPWESVTLPWSELASAASTTSRLRITSTEGRTIYCWSVQKANIRNIVTGHSFSDDVARDILAQQAVYLKGS